MKNLGVKNKLSIEELTERFTTLTHLMYDTNVNHKILDERVTSQIHEDVTFTDPWQTNTGKGIFITQLRGFHSAIFFNFDIEQINVQLYDNELGGRVIVDGWMNLNQFKTIVGTYPLRTILVYDFIMTNDGKDVLVTDLEEMWSLADLIEQIPIVGWMYHLFRWGAGYFFTVMFFLCTFVALRLPFMNVSGKTKEKKPDDH